MAKFFSHIAFGVCLFAISASPHASSAMQDSTRQRPAYQGIRSHQTDIKHIALDLRFDWKKRQAYGTATITLVPFYRVERITLDAGMLNIQSVRLPGNKPLAFSYDGGDRDDGLAIMLDRPYNAGEEVMITIQYNTNWINETDPNNLGGSNGKGIRFFEPTSMEPNRRKQLWSMGDIESNRYWFPGYDFPNDQRTTEFRATVDSSLTVISNGSLTGVTVNDDGTRTFQFNETTPYSNHLTSFIVGEYVDVLQRYGDISLHNYAYPDEVAATKASVERLPDMIKFFSERIGVRYPYSAYTQAFVQDLPWSISGSSLSTQTENMVDDYGTHADFLYLWDGLEGEALARQWFGSFITPRDWSHCWLSRGFGRYFSSLYDEHKNGRAEFLMYQHAFDQGTYMNDWHSGIIEPVVNSHYENATILANSNYPGFRGASVLHMLRKHLGDEKWWKAISHYVATNGNKLVATEDFRQAVEEVTGESMDWFFDQWLYQTGHPVFEVTKTYTDASKELKLRIKQTQKSDSVSPSIQTKYFQGKMEIEIDDKIETVWIAPKIENVFTFNTEHNPKLVNVDYESAWIKELVCVRTLEELLYQFQNDTDILGRVSAMNELVGVAKKDETKSSDKKTIYAAFRSVILSDSYWRLRSIALSQLRGLMVNTTTQTAVALDDVTLKMLLRVIKTERSWIKASAINFLGATRNKKFSKQYIDALKDSSDRVVNAAAIALGKSKSAHAYPALLQLIDKPSWKNQSLISSLNGLKELGDPRGFDIAQNALSDLRLSRWSLPTPIWDFRIAAVETIVALGRAADAYPLIAERVNIALREHDLNVIFNNVALLSALGDIRGLEVFENVRGQLSANENAMIALGQYETQLKESVARIAGRPAK